MVRDYLCAKLSAMSLSTRFVVASIFVVCGAMILTGAWVDSRIKKSVFRNAALSSARIIEGVLQDPLQDLGSGGVVSVNAKAAAKAVVDDVKHGRRILQVKIWLPDGTVAYTTEGTQIGEKPPMSVKLAGALAGQVTADFDNLDDVESESERKSGVPLFEVYAPVRKNGTDRIIGAVEFYEDASELKREFAAARYESWLVIGVLTIAMLSLLFSIVHWGTLLIKKQKRALELTIGEQSALLQQNEELRVRIMRAGQDNSDLSDRLLRRVGADLHDGPAQLLGLALLRLHELGPAPAKPPHMAEAVPTKGAEALNAVRSSMQEALAEIRNISTGVSLPELTNLNVSEVLELAASTHERRTKTRVRRAFGDLPDVLTQAASTCLFRTVQEALNNAFRHAAAHGQFVAATMDEHMVHLRAGDAGPGFEVSKAREAADGLGLVGIRHRAELLNGSFEIQSGVGIGTTIVVSIPRVTANV